VLSWLIAGNAKRGDTHLPLQAFDDVLNQNSNT
jgi:hypothetical protein